jgi:chromate transporter
VRELSLYFLRLGAIGFGGPIALVGYMQRDLVERRKWVSEAEFGEGLAFSQLAPGPLAAQLAIWLGWSRGRVRGATLTGLAFVAPSFLMVVALSALYVRYDGLPWMRGAFYGVGAAVIAILARSAARLARITLARDGVLWVIFAVNAAVVIATASERLWIFVASGAAAMIAQRSLPHSLALCLPLLPLRSLPVPQLAADTAALTQQAGLFELLWFFGKAGAIVFGSGLAIVPFLYGGVVQQYGWLDERQFLDAVAVSMITPGPVVITVAFIGWMQAGFPGAVAAATGVFLPVWLVVLIAAPWFERWSANTRVRAFVRGVIAAASGAIAGAALVLGRRAIFDATTLTIALVALALLSRFRRLPDPLIIIAAGAAGFLLFPAA